MVLFWQWVASVDLFPNEDAHANVVVTKTDSWTEQNEEVKFRSANVSRYILNHLHVSFHLLRA